MKRKQRPVGGTPVRGALLPTSALQTRIEHGLGAMKGEHRSDLDEGLRPTHGQENRWDYLLGHAPSTAVIGLEPHSAKEDEVSKVIAKCAAARDQLRSHLKANARVAAWLWVASGKVHFADTERARRRLDQHGIQFVGTRVLQKHLESVVRHGPK
jgi:hypothetical protein